MDKKLVILFFYTYLYFFNNLIPVFYSIKVPQEEIKIKQ
ncbi:MAG: hypothetical protein BAJALOKI1v1_90028 [Promethearchaeota archaeon]|nr:MAG: hypothetical protein BAJALOKI1v1_90028 [Candidatus Lokiarchaeota archaeon]